MKTMEIMKTERLSDPKPKDCRTQNRKIVGHQSERLSRPKPKECRTSIRKIVEIPIGLLEEKWVICKSSLGNMPITLMFIYGENKKKSN